MILTGNQIRIELEKGNITLDPFDPDQINPNSYNYRLAPDLAICADPFLDPSKKGAWKALRIPKDGIVLEPHKLYLGSTVERIGSSRFVPSLIGRSSLGRLGMFLQASADLGNLGAIHCWTLEITVIQPLRVYANMQGGQVSFWTARGDVQLYSGIYNRFSCAMPSQRWNRDLDRAKG